METIQVLTRKDYLSGSCTHREYYSQFVTEHIKQNVLYVFPLDKLKMAFSEDEHFNSLPLFKWDNISLGVLAIPMKDAGDYLTMAGKVCILKEAARQLINKLI